MNREEYYSRKMCTKPKIVKDAFKRWKLENNITERCMIHHREDTEETRKYNEEHYELWGCNLDGTFEYGKYVLFVTQSEHNTIHFTGHIYSDEYRKRMSESNRGEKNGMFGRTHSDETKRKISDANRGKLKGHKVPDEVKARRKRARDATSYLYAVYKNNSGSLMWGDFRRALHIGEITFEKENYNGSSIYTDRDI